MSTTPDRKHKNVFCNTEACILAEHLTGALLVSTHPIIYSKESFLQSLVPQFNFNPEVANQDFPIYLKNTGRSIQAGLEVNSGRQQQTTKVPPLLHQTPPLPADPSSA